jgi:hypothetical protein
MPSNPQYLYWDSCVFLSYFDQQPGRWPVLDALLAEVRHSQGQRKIVTSTFTQIEVAYLATEAATHTLDADFEHRLEVFWADRTIVELIEVHPELTHLARQLMRQGLQAGWRRLKPPDALHLASAQWLTSWRTVQAFHTYNVGDYRNFAASMPFTICEPTISQPFLL